MRSGGFQRETQTGKSCAPPHGLLSIITSQHCCSGTRSETIKGFLDKLIEVHDSLRNMFQTNEGTAKEILDIMGEALVVLK